METLNQLCQGTLPDPAALGATGSPPPLGTAIVRTRISVEELKGLPELWSRHGLDEAQVQTIRRDLKSGSEVLIPVAGRSEPGREDDMVDLVAGEHRVAAASQEGCEDLAVYVLVCKSSETSLWLLREGASPGTSRRVLQRGWAIERWIRETGFKGTQRELSVRLGIRASTLSELLSFARALPEDVVTERSERAGIPVNKVVQLQRSEMRKLKGYTPDEALGLLDRAMMTMSKGTAAETAWRDALQSSPDPKSVRRAPSATLLGVLTHCRGVCFHIRGRLAATARTLPRTMVDFLLRALDAVRRLLLTAKARLDAKIDGASPTPSQGSPQEGPSESSPGEFLCPSSAVQSSPREVSEPLRRGKSALRPAEGRDFIREPPSRKSDP